jgi:hypothetical protein
MQDFYLYSRRSIGRIAGYVTEVAYTEVGEGREQDAEALQRRRQIKRQVRLVGYLLRVALPFSNILILMFHSARMNSIKYHLPVYISILLAISMTNLTCLLSTII